MSIKRIGQGVWMVAFAVWLCRASQAIAAEGTQVEVAWVRGEATIQSGASPRRAAVKQDRLVTGDILRTGQDGTVGLTVEGPGRALRMEPSGELRVLSAPAGKFGLGRGAATLLAGPGSPAMELRSSTAAVRVREGACRVSAMTPGKVVAHNHSASEMSVSPLPPSGAVAGPLRLEPGHSTTVVRESRPGPPAPASIDEVQAAMVALQEMRTRLIDDPIAMVVPGDTATPEEPR